MGMPIDQRIGDQPGMNDFTKFLRYLHTMN